MHIRRILALVVTTSLGLVFSAAARADNWSVLDLGYVTASGINSSGQVVGLSGSGGFVTGNNGIGMTYIDLSGGPANAINNSGQIAANVTQRYGAYRWGWRSSVVSGGSVAILPSLPGYITHSMAEAINNSGQVAGNSVVVPGYDCCYSGSYHATLWNGSSTLSLGTFGGIDSFAYGLNDSGQVVGHYVTASNISRAYITGANGIGMRELDTLGGLNSYANGINASGQVIGNANTAGNTTTNAFITGPNGSGTTDLGTLGGTSSYAFGINASGIVVGHSRIAGNVASHAFITGANGAGMTDLNSLVVLGGGDYFTEARGVNDLGQIVANSQFGRAYLLSVSAVPSPETYAILLAGLGLMGALARLRKRKQG